MKPIKSWKLGNRNAGRSNGTAQQNDAATEIYRQVARIHAAWN